MALELHAVKLYRTSRDPNRGSRSYLQLVKGPYAYTKNPCEMATIAFLL